MMRQCQTNTIIGEPFHSNIRLLLCCSFPSYVFREHSEIQIYPVLGDLKCIQINITAQGQFKSVSLYTTIPSQFAGVGISFLVSSLVA